MNDPAQKLMRFVIVLHGDNDPATWKQLKTIQEFAAPSFLLTDDPAIFWGNHLGHQHGVNLGCGSLIFNVDRDDHAFSILQEIGPWVGEKDWVIYLPHVAQAGLRSRNALQNFLQFVGIQPDSIEYVRSVTPTNDGKPRTLLRIGTDSEILETNVDESLFEITDDFWAWRSLSASEPHCLRENIERTAFWTRPKSISAE